jgi:hypothetical protein
VTAERAALSRNASIVSPHTAEPVMSVVTVQTADQSVAVALAVMSEALKRPAVSPIRRRPVMADLVRQLVEPGVPAVFGAARPAPLFFWYSSGAYGSQARLVAGDLVAVPCYCAVSVGASGFRTLHSWLLVVGAIVSQQPFLGSL